MNIMKMYGTPGGTKLAITSPLLIEHVESIKERPLKLKIPAMTQTCCAGRPMENSYKISFTNR